MLMYLFIVLSLPFYLSSSLCHRAFACMWFWPHWCLETCFTSACNTCNALIDSIDDTLANDCKICTSQGCCVPPVRVFLIPLEPSRLSSQTSTISFYLTCTSRCILLEASLISSSPPFAFQDGSVWSTILHGRSRELHNWLSTFKLTSNL